MSGLSVKNLFLYEVGEGDKSSRASNLEQTIPPQENFCVNETGASLVILTYMLLSARHTVHVASQASKHIYIYIYIVCCLQKQKSMVPNRT